MKNVQFDAQSAKTKLIQMLKERWAGKDMETYFIQKNEEWIARLQNELKK